MVEIEQFKIGQTVRVVQSDGKPWTADWRETYIVVGAQLEYQRRGCKINYSVASTDDIQRKAGSTDGMYADDLAPA